MATEVLLDTSYLLAWHRQNDRLHPRAMRIQETLEQAKPIRIVLDCVYSELIAVLARTEFKDEGRADEFLREERKLRQVYWPRLVWMAYLGGRDLLKRAIEVSREAARKHGAGISPHDAMLLILCHERDIRFLVSFDKALGQVKTIEGQRLELLVVDDSNREALLNARRD
jgi:predicted nucleic acid-binding protein